MKNLIANPAKQKEVKMKTNKIQNYMITEQVKSWVITCKKGAVTLEYKIDKEICATLDDLRAYVEKEKLF